MSKIKINLFVNYYQCGNKERQKEIDFCLDYNKKSNLFSEIIIFDGRPTYNDFFKETKNYPNDINILTNSDIYFNDTILKVKEMTDSQCYCITRWEEDEEKGAVRFKEKHVYNNEAKEKYSQDVWVFKGKTRSINGRFNLGVPGCDNRIAYEITMSGYKVSNPCPDIQCIHKHKNPERNYTLPHKVPPPYKFIDPCNEATNFITRRKSIR